MIEAIRSVWGNVGFNDLFARTPVIMQSERAECSLACLAMILGYHGHQIDLISLRKKLGSSSRGVNLAQFVKMADELNLSADAMHIEDDYLKQVNLPCVLHWNENHFVVLTKVGKKYITIHDPGFGLRKINKDTLDNHFSGIIIEFFPNDRFTKKNEERKLKLMELLDGKLSELSPLIKLTAIMLFSQLLLVALPLFTQSILDYVVIDQNENLLLPLIAGFSLILLMKNASQYIYQWISLYFSNRISYQLVQKVFGKLIRLPLEYFEKKDLGDITNRFQSIHHIRHIITTTAVTCSVNLFLMLVTYVAILSYSLLIGMLVLGFVITYFLLRFYYYSDERILTEETFVAHAGHENKFIEAVRTIQTVKIFQQEQNHQKQWLKKTESAIDSEITLSKFMLNVNTISELIFGIEFLVTTSLAAYLVLAEQISIGMFFALIGFKTFFLDSSRQFISEAFHLRLIELHLGRISDIVLSEQDATYQPNLIDTREKLDAASLRVENLSFQYSSNEPFVFERVNIEVMPREFVAIIGASGCGKTTFLKCLLGLLEINHGQITINNDLFVSSGRYKSNIAAVMQNDTLFNGTIKENVTCFSDNVDEKLLDEVLDLACIRDDVYSMPMGVNSLLGDLGVSLSGGQKQRLEIARALYRKPSILFMDEATSHLDPSIEKQINKNIASLGTTRIIVAHRKETIESADRTIDFSQFQKR